ncbi:endonuclease V [Terrihabitans soli]|uniref:Endonuclease V n=1 Tax=Terrihabitans soli TaxID=708113 RepID=A0A6S6QQR2_9HYPH|nr:deoxyribonuclease V [Terrihabitans soli]BCJ90105.1 endonuclease V [Terrihabitans soli]
MKLKHLHSWDITPKDAVQLQHALRDQVIADRPLDLSKIRTVAGVDVSVKNNVSQAAVTVLTFPDFKPVETALAQRPTTFPYVPGLLSFREGEVLVDAFTKLKNVPDVFMFDGSGYLHPRRIGIASHIGLWLGVPTIANAKNRLCGAHDGVGPERGDWRPVTHKDEVIGAALRTKAGCKPVFVSAGHLSDLESAVSLVMSCLTKYRLPEPVRAAHKAAGVFG